jgi:hypothetical protein
MGVDGSMTTLFGDASLTRDRSDAGKLLWSQILEQLDASRARLPSQTIFSPAILITPSRCQQRHSRSRHLGHIGSDVFGSVLNLRRSRCSRSSPAAGDRNTPPTTDPPTE